MAVSNRLRYEILLRDNQTCRYCGTSSDIVPLNVDHVVPRILGGKDVPENLVAACQPCNSGKNSSMPKGVRISDVDPHVLNWAASTKHLHYEVQLLISSWDEWLPGVQRSPIAPFIMLDYLRLGLSFELILVAVDNAVGAMQGDPMFLLDFEKQPAANEVWDWFMERCDFWLAEVRLKEDADAS